MRFTILLIIPVLLTCKGFAQDFHDRHFTDTNHLFLNIVTDKGAHQYVSPDLRGFANFSQEHFELKSNLKSFIPRGPYSAPGLIKNLFLKDSLFDDLTILIFFPEDQDLNMEDFEGQKIKIQGTVYHHDGKTPASDVILYVYHTDQSGQYTAEAFLRLF